MDAVRSEPFSTTNSLLTGKLTGNFANHGRVHHWISAKSLDLRAFSNEFIDFGTGNFRRWNREFVTAEQGIFGHEQ